MCQSGTLISWFRVKVCIFWGSVCQGAPGITIGRGLWFLHLKSWKNVLRCHLLKDSGDRSSSVKGSWRIVHVRELSKIRGCRKILFLARTMFWVRPDVEKQANLWGFCKICLYLEVAAYHSSVNLICYFQIVHTILSFMILFLSSTLSIIIFSNKSIWTVEFWVILCNTYVKQGKKLVPLFQ